MTLHRALPLLLAAGFLFVSACKKPTIEDTKLIPDDNLGIEFTDTLTLLTSNIIEDSLDVNAATVGLLGSLNDPFLGYTNASFYQPFRLNNNNLTFGDTTITLDSIVLMMEYFDVYGDWRTRQTVEVFEVTEALPDSTTYSFQAFDVDPTIIGTKTFSPDFRDTIEADGVRYAPSLRMRLSNTFGQKFIEASGTTDYATNEDFREFFKGLYITTSRGGGGKGLVAFDPYQTGIRLSLYYHVLDSAARYHFTAEPTQVVNRYQHDYRNSVLNQAGDSLVVIQGLAGVNSKFTVPNIKNLGDIIINKAELVITVLPSTVDNDTLFSPPARLTLVVSDSTGNFAGTTPDQAFPSSIFGGNMKEETDSSGQKLIKYKFSLSRYYQEVISGIRQDYGIFILPNTRYQIPDRLVAGGGSHSQYALKLNLTYEQID